VLLLYIVFHIALHSSSSKDDLYNNTYCVVITIGGFDTMGQCIYCMTKVGV
jgi:hypothetical protein